MNKYFFVFIVYVVIIFTTLITWQQARPKDPNVYYGLAESQEITEKWILKNSPTYKFDGFDLKIEDAQIMRCFSCFEFTFSFKSRQAGYGDRENQVLAQVITPHTMAVTVNQGEVVQAVTDQIYDEIKGEFLE